MTIFITQGRYSDQAMKAFLDKPEDRTEVARQVIEAAGGTLIAFYVTFGEYDFMLIAEADSEVDVAGALMAVAAAGTVTAMKTTIALSGADAKAAMERGKRMTGAYRVPGG
jgi:uncharacterized protein with GYD domain